LEKNADAILAGAPDLLARIVARSCEIKAAVVGQDEREEGGLRATLNFGHTAGHAIEAVSGYGHFLHGEAIAIGMAYAARLSRQQAGLAERDMLRLVQLLRRFGLPTEIPDCPWQPIRMAMGVDKKSAGGRPRFVLASRIGAVQHGCEVAEDRLRAAWESKTVAQGHGF
jgi:3-dehydroquinate synthase